MTSVRKVLFIDDWDLYVRDFTFKRNRIRAWVVNGAWSLVIDTKKKIGYAMSDDTVVTKRPYSQLTYVDVPAGMGGDYNVVLAWARKQERQYFG
jgi:hypothetical protein